MLDLDDLGRPIRPLSAAQIGLVADRLDEVWEEAGLTIEQMGNLLVLLFPTQYADRGDGYRRRAATNRARRGGVRSVSQKAMAGCDD